MVNQFGIINLNDTYLLPGPLFSEATGYINSLELTDDERVILYWVKKCRPISFIQKQLNIDDKILGNFIQSLQDKQMLQQTRANAHQARSWHYSSFNQYIEDSENSNLRTLWGKAVQSFGNKAYILDRNDKTVYTYGEFDEIVKYVTSTLIQYKIGKGDKIILHADINFEAIALFWACMHLGVVFIPVNSSLAEAVMVGLIEKLDPKLVFLSHDAGFCKIWPDKTIFFDKEINLPNKLYFSIWLKDSLDIKDMPEINENDMAVILYTSGSTGAPKGVKLANGQLYSSALNMVKTYLWNEHDINLSTNDLDSIAGFRNACFATVAAGAACVIPNLAERNSPAELLTCIYETGTTCLTTGPGLLNQLMTRKDVKTSLEKTRYVISSGSALTTHLKTEFFEKTNKRISNLLGMTEAAGLVACEPPGSTNLHGNFIGYPVDCIVKMVDDNNNSVKVGEIGELLLYGYAIFKGYYNEHESNANEVQKWFVTGDLARINTDGSIELTGRKKDFMKNARGEIVYFNEIENVLKTLPFIKDLGIVAFFEAESERGALFIELENNLPPPKNIVEKIKNELANSIGTNKIPSVIKVVNKIPRNKYGKLLKAELSRFL